MEDLFEQLEILPNEVIQVLDKFTNSNMDYESCQRLVDELELIGYTCEYGLDACPYGLKKLEQ